MAERELPALSSGIPGLDVVLSGGFAEGRMFVIKGGLGTGKTTLALQFLLEGVSRGEHCLYIGVGGVGASICAIADSNGWYLDSQLLAVHEITMPADSIMAPKRRAFHSAEVDLSETVKGVLDVIEKVQPTRVVIDTFAELRLVCQDEIEYRRMFMALMNALQTGKRTILVTDYGEGATSDLHLEALAHGSILLQTIAQDFGKERRRLRVVKYRARQVRSGWHDFIIQTGGIVVFPAIVCGEYQSRCPDTVLNSGNDDLDKIQGGGIDCGTVTAIIGPSGTGKSSLATQYAVAAAERGRRSTIFLFDETEESFKKRAAGLGLSITDQVEKGVIALRQLDVAELSPGEFAQTLIKQVAEGVTLVVIDSLNGYVNAMREERLLFIQLHELMSFLNKSGVTTFMTVTQHGIVGAALEHSLDVSYLADNIILLRNFESYGEVRRAISVLKKRQGSHELTIRELKLSDRGIQLSEPLHRLQGIFNGVPKLES